MIPLYQINTDRFIWGCNISPAISLIAYPTLQQSCNYTWSTPRYTMMFWFVSPFHNTFLVTCHREVWWHSMAHVRRNSGTCHKNFVLVRVSVVGIASRYGLEGPGIESQLGARFSAPLQTGHGIHPASCRRITESFPGIKRPGRGVALTIHPHQTPRVKKKKSYTSTHPLGLRGFYWVKLLHVRM